MFTGIVEELGTVAAREELSDSARITIRADRVVADASPGDSMAVNGVCLTVVRTNGSQFSADVMRETLDRTALGAVSAGDAVNLERPVTPTTRLGGHLVQGHVDGVGTVLAREDAEHWTVVRIGVPSDLARYVVAKGSVAVDGVSLTVVDVTDDAFTVSLIPTTLALTTLGSREVGEAVNIEVDVLAKYVERLLAVRAEPRA